jgi:hypothetical protein
MLCLDRESNPQPKRDKLTVPSAWAFQKDKVYLVLAIPIIDAKLLE